MLYLPFFSWYFVYYIMVASNILMAGNWRSHSSRQCVCTVAINFVVTTRATFYILIRVITRNFHLVLISMFTVMVRAVVSISLLRPIKSVDVSTYDSCYIFWLPIRVFNAVTRVRLTSLYWCLHFILFRYNVLEVWIITVHFFLEFKQSLAWFTLTLNHKLRSIMNLCIIYFAI